MCIYVFAVYRCYVAPERFYDGKTQPRPTHSSASGEGGLSPSMDVFSVGCVIAEIFLEGEALFDLPQLLSYRSAYSHTHSTPSPKEPSEGSGRSSSSSSSGKYDPLLLLQKIEDQDVATMVAHMIQLDPSQRFSAEQYLQLFSQSPSSSSSSSSSSASSSCSIVNQVHGFIFPSYFPFLYRFFAKLLSPELCSPDVIIQTVRQSESLLLREVMGVEAADTANNQHQHATRGRRVSTTTDAVQALLSGRSRLSGQGEVGEVLGGCEAHAHALSAEVSQLSRRPTRHRF
jgi:serine/threonine protein kinase